MNKNELIAAIIKKSHMTKTQAENAYQIFFDAVSSAKKKSSKVTLVGFGSFKVADRKARVEIKSKYGAKTHLKAHRVPTFRAGKHLKEKIE